MRHPARPPDPQRALERFLASPERLLQALEALGGPPDRAYLPWDDLRRRDPPEGLTLDEWWALVRVRRLAAARHLPLHDVAGRRFWFVPTDALAEGCHEVDLRAGGRLAADERLVNADTRDQYVFDSLIEEAISSSQIEGAVTTRRVAADMIRSGRAPRNLDERMIANNFRAMQHVRGVCAEPLTVAGLLEVHRIVTEGTLDDPASEGRLRRHDDVVVSDVETGDVVHVPPRAADLPDRLGALCDFANGMTPDFHVHPLVRAMLLHFALAYDHPFDDGNGRTARALFYWAVLRAGYWLFEFLPVSRVIHRTKRDYYRAFLLTEGDAGDATYFLLYHLGAVRRSLDDLDAWLTKRKQEIRRVEAVMRGSAALNHRQEALVAHALRHPGAEYTFVTHQRSHGVVYETARADLVDLAEKGVLSRIKRGRKFVFRPVDDLEGALRLLAPGG